MPFDTEQIEHIIKSPADAQDLATYRMATTNWPIVLPDDMAAALGAVFSRRRLTPFAGVTVDVVSSKMEIDREALKLPGATETKAVKAWLSDDNWASTERELWSVVVRDGKGFLLVNWDLPDPASPDFEEPKPCFKVIPAFDGHSGAGQVCGDDDKPEFAFNAWLADDDYYFDAYFPDRIEKYIKRKEAAGKTAWAMRQDSEDELWPLPWTSEDGTPLGIPLLHFGIGGSDIADAIQISRDLNDALLDMLAMGRTQGWPQRFIKGSRNSDVMTNGLGQPIVSAHTGRPIKKQVVLAPGSVMLLNEGSELGQLPSATPSPNVVDKLMEMLAFVTTVPSHYFSGEWPSGVAIGQSEGRLNHKVEDHQSRLSQPMAKTIALMLRLSNHFAGTSFKTVFKIVVPWHSPEVETYDIKIEREAAVREHTVDLYAAGLMTLKTSIKLLHPDWTEDEIDEEVAALEKTKKDAADLAHQQLLEAKTVQSPVGSNVATAETPAAKSGE
jgi:hypothetical protein